MKTYRAKVIAKEKVIGDYTHQYALLRDYALELQETNPNTTVKIDIEDVMDVNSPNRQFKRIYICIGSLKVGFKSGMRNLLGVDGCHMKGPFPGQILTAVGIDGNNGTYPLAYGVVEAETYDSWVWFLTNLGDDLELTNMSNFTFISDRQKGLLPAMEKVFPSAEHRYCLRHIHENMKKNWRGDTFKHMLWGCATATTVRAFERQMQKLKDKNIEAYNWLREIPPMHWARSHFSGIAKCDVLLNNLCEVFNRQLIDGRDKPIITCLDFIREYLMKRIVIVQKVIGKSKGPLTPSATIAFEQIKKEAAQYTAIWNGSTQYQVSGPHQDQCVVNINASDKTGTCSCRKWELTGMPCKHVVATIWNMELNDVQVAIPERWVHPSYWLSTWKEQYEFKVNPINGRNQWPISSCPTILTPPKHHKQVGRPKKKRRKSQVEINDKLFEGLKVSRAGISGKCSKCKLVGHNAKTCKGQSDGAAGPSVDHAGPSVPRKRGRKAKKPRTDWFGESDGAAGQRDNVAGPSVDVAGPDV